MGYLRKKSFLIFSDENAPTEVTTLDPQEVAKIEAAHQEGKQGRIEELILNTLAPSSRELMERSAKITKMERWVEPENFFGSEEERQQQLKVLEELRTQQAAAEEARRLTVAGPEGDRLRRIVQRVQGASGIEDQLKEFIRTDPETSGQENQHMRNFAWKVFEIDTSKPDFPDTRYIPSRSSQSTVRFKDDWRIGVNVMGRTTKQVDGKEVLRTETEILQDQNPTLWVKVADGAWSKDGNWGGYLQVTCATDEGKWIDSSSGWVTTVASKVDPVAFYDMGNYYEIWQNNRETGRPMIVEDGCLRFVEGATPGKFNLQDSTWD
ncbi:hypothetical protein [Streptomyces sp. NPDC012888]|uniref:hypothetical protein n=1 Tax=Streptomyces sp. NPDC012888 TaxID=3364855 RepID=UPI0036B72C97